MTSESMVYGLTTSGKMMHRMIDTLKPNEFEYQPFPGVNCVAWILGHLTDVNHRTLTSLGASDIPVIPEGFLNRFGVTRQPAAEQGGYGDPAELVRLYDAMQERLIAVVAGLSTEQLSAALPSPTPLFSTRGEMLLFLGIHTTMHVGQISMIRRHLGYPPTI